MKKITEEIYLRSVEPEEANLWREIFFDSARGHFALLGLPENELNQLLEMQFQAQNADYQKNYPNASNDLILFRENVAGRVVVSTEHDDLHLVDLAVLSRFRNRGIGTEVLKWIFEQSRRTKLHVRFYVEKQNRAFRLYERMGFKIAADANSHFQMRWLAEDEG